MRTRLTPIASLRVPLGGQQIELQQVDFEDAAAGVSAPGGPQDEQRSAQRDGSSISLLRTRIREASRFTVFDIDAQTALAWGRALQRWAESQPQG